MVYESQKGPNARHLTYQYSGHLVFVLLPRVPVGKHESSCSTLAKASALYRGQNPQNREKSGFRGQKTPISHRLRKGLFESKNPHFPYRAL